MKAYNEEFLPSESCNEYDLPVESQSRSMHSQTERNGQAIKTSLCHLSKIIW